MSSDELVLGPLLRYVDETTAAIWVETARAGRVSVRAGERAWVAPTFLVHGHHYALVQVDGLSPGSVQDYAVDIDGQEVWPPADSPFPPSRIATLDGDRDLRLLYGSCRTSVPHDRAGNRTHGVDALRAYALRMAAGDADAWPDLVLFLGDQVYADETSEAMREFISSRRDIEQPPGEELQDYEEYAHLYELAWSDPANRWLLSTLPSAMIFDDHDIRDDWNTSATWRREMEATSWWHGRIVGGLSSYWVYQHLGNLSPAERDEDEIWQHVRSTQDSDEEVDLGPLVDTMAERVDQEPDTYRWSFARDIGRSRLVVVDSRAARVLKPDQRSILDDSEMAWFRDQLQGGFDHLLIGTSLPYLLSNGLHSLEAWDEAMATGAWGKRAAKLGERIRQGLDLEHWAAFQDGFAEVAKTVLEVAEGKRGPAPATVIFLAGDVHHSYVAEVTRVDGRSRIVQVVCSPIRNPLPKAVRYATAFMSYGVATALGALACRSPKVPTPPFEWKVVKGPWFDNNIATLETEGRRLRLRWETGVVRRGHDEDDPRLRTVSEFDID